MSGEPQGLATFPGIEQVVAWSVSLTHGVSPSVLTIVTAPQEDFVGQGGDFAIGFGDVSFTFSACKIDRAHYHDGAAGQVWTLTIVDRRWKWQGLGLLGGAYNLRNDDNTLRKNAILKSPQQLFALCLDALQEQGYDVGDAPSSGNPTLEWDAVRPADALADLCDQFGCRVVLRSDDTVKICVLGQGASLPLDGDVMENSLTINPPERPDQTAILCAPNRYQVDLPLAAVGAEADGTIKPIDALSYAPAGGWSSVDLLDFRAVAAASRSLAKKWIFRAYQIAAPFAVAKFGQVNALDQILPIEAGQVATATDAAGHTSNLPAMVFGQFFSDGEAVANNAAALPADFGAVTGGAIYNRPFAIDRQRGVVWFREQVFSNQNAAVPLVPVAAQIYLRAAIGVRDPATGAWTRYTRTRGGGNQFNTPPLVVKHDEIQYAVTPQYNGQSLAGAQDNAADVNALCDALLDAIDNYFKQAYPQAVKYAGIRRIEVDGAIQQVLWQGGPAGATTLAAYNQEISLGPQHGQRRVAEMQRQLRDLLPLAQPGILQRQLKLLVNG